MNDEATPRRPGLGADFSLAAELGLLAKAGFEAQLEFLARASEVLSSSLEYETTLERVAQLAVPALADWCVIGLLEEDHKLRYVAVSHADPEKVRLARELQERYPPDPDAPHGMARVVKTGESALYPEMTDEVLAAAAIDDEHLRILRELGFSSALLVPLTARDRTLGALGLATAESRRRYDEADRRFAEELARRAAVAIDNARLYREAERSARDANQANAVIDAIFERSPVGKAFLDTELRYLRINGALAEINGLSPENHIGRTVSEVLPELAPTIEPLLRRALAGETIADVEISAPRPSGNGEQGDWLVHYYPVPSQNGEVLGVGVAIVDISERKHAERALAESDARKKAILDSTLDAIVTIDASGRIVELNPAAERMFGFSEEQAVGRELAETLIPERLRDQHRRGLARYRESGQEVVIGQRLELPAVRADGSEFLVELTVTRVDLDRPHAEMLFSATMRDLTERERARVQREQLERALAEAQKLEAVGRLAGGVAHDFNNLLTVICGFSDRLVRLLESGPLRDDAVQISKAAERGAYLTRQMLAIGRRQERRLQMLSLNALLAGTKRLLRGLLGEDIVLVLELDPTLNKVYADPHQVEQILFNLAANARDAMPEGGTLTIATENVEIGETNQPAHPLRLAAYALLTISDTGMGMDEVTRAHAFEPFFTTKDVGQGSGLGLSSVYGIVEQSNGTIELETSPGNGTCFRIYLPQQGGPDGAEPVEGPGRRTVLLVEDDDSVRLLVQLILQEAGYRVLSAASGPEALELSAAEAGSIDVVLTDVVMPEMSGPRLVEELANERSGLKVIYMSGYTQEALADRTTVRETDEVLQKPFQPEELLARIDAAISTP